MSKTGQPSPYSSNASNQSADWIAGYAAGHAGAVSQINSRLMTLVKEIEALTGDTSAVTLKHTILSKISDIL